ncbi:MAG TPA: filamentous hemagglutinin N-terminal domain-containing protein [Rhizomicrobium sp.]
MSGTTCAVLKTSASIFVLSMALATANDALAGGLPSKGHFVAGHGSINKATESMTVKQSSTTGIVDWKGFNVGAKNSVTFDNGSGATLNRVTGGNLSRIAGSMNATGSLYLMNSRGVVVSNTGKIVTGGNFFATSANVSTDAFGDGSKLRLRNAKAAVINHGTISAGGDARLVGGEAINTGTIKAARVNLRAENGEAVAGGNITATGSASESPRVIVISTKGKTDVTGNLTAQTANGGAGTIETSGRKLDIAGTIDAGTGGHWRIDPVDLKVGAKAATSIDKALDAGTNVKLQTTRKAAMGAGQTHKGAGNIAIDSALSWNTGASLTVDAYHSINVKNLVKAAGGGNVNLNTKKGTLLFSGGELTFANPGSSQLQINGAQYTLVDSLSALIDDLGANPSGNFALSGNTSGAGATYSGSLVNAKFSGSFEGLGHKIGHLTISAKNKSNVGLFREIGAQGSVDNLRLKNVAIVGAGAGVDVGGIAGTSHGRLFGDHVNGQVRAGVNGRAGGLVGLLAKGATISQSTSGALVADSQTGAKLGGIAGAAAANSNIMNVSASGAVNGADGADLGGLVGFSNGATLSDSYATGAVTDTSGGNVGGLVGDNAGLIDASYATGAVRGEGSAQVGGLVGTNSGQIRNAYAKGDVTGGSLTDVGGFAGSNSGTVSTSYSTGEVTGQTNGLVGGFVGDDTSKAGITSSYWDTSSSGISKKHGAGNVSSDSGISGITTARLASALPAGFSSAVWKQSASINGGMPYLIALSSSY